MIVTLEARFVNVGSKVIAVTKIGGFTVRGQAAGTPVGAYKNLLWKLSGNGPQDEDAELGVELLVADTTLQEELERQAETPRLNADNDHPS